MPPSRLGAEDLGEFNHWLWLTRVRALIVVTVVLGVQQVVSEFFHLQAAAASATARGDAQLILGIVGLDLAASLGYHRWWQRGWRPRLLLYVQLANDTLAIGMGLCLLTVPLPPLFHLILLLPLIPASLIEWQCGMFIASLGSALHVLTLSHHGMPLLTVDGLLPPIGLFLIAQQSAFYSEHLARKNAALAQAAASLKMSKERLEEEVAVSSALVQTARALTTSLDPYEILQRFNEVLRDNLGCDFSVTLLHDANRDAFRIAAGAGQHPDVLEALRHQEFKRSDFPLLTAVSEHEVATVEDNRTSLIPSELLRTWRIGSFLCIDLRRAGHSVGLLVAGFNERQGPFAEREVRLLRASAQQAAVALENARLVESLRAASRLKSEFIGTMSHELRSPLNVVIGYVDLILEGDMGAINAVQTEALQKVQQNALQLLDLIQETLDVNRLEAGMLPLDFETFTLADFMAELRGGIPATWTKPAVQLVWQVPNGVAVLHSDRAKLRKVLRNLIHNAIKFTETGAVTISAIDGSDWVEFVVADTGIGISDDIVPIIFEMFRQGDGSTTRRHGGVGLGLYIVKQLVRGLGGDINVASTPGSGSTFRIRLGRGTMAHSQTDAVAI